MARLLLFNVMPRSTLLGIAKIKLNDIYSSHSCVQACSQTATSRANTALHNLKEKKEEEEIEDVGKEVYKVLCSALNRIRTNCLRKLNRCFNQRDMGRMVEGQVDEMRTYLTRLAGNRLGSEQLDACDLDIRHEEEEIEDVYGEDGTHHFVFYDVADREVGTHSFTFESVDETVSNRTLTEVIDIRGGENGEELQDWLWGESELDEKEIEQEQMYRSAAVYPIQSRSTSFSPCLAVLVMLLASACGLN